MLDVVPTLPTMQQPLSGITGGSLSDYMQLRLEKALYFSTEAVVLPETCSHFLMCKIVGVSLKSQS